ncbi:MAG: substrate-binding domain-containing protein [Verrucomicrobia bacterium]|jgi:LacI family transcriptional regulator|nr:substrate-binding domain-containing protein [Verrucomicrobiota bacterium]
MKTKKIAVLGDINFEHANALLSGIKQYADENANWEVVPLHFSQEKALGRLVAEGRIDGLIGAILSDRLAAALRSHNDLPIVNTSSLSVLHTVPSVIPDDHAIGALAAEHFVRRRYDSLFFAGVRSYACSNARLSGFTAVAEQNGIQVSALPYADLTTSLAEWCNTLAEAKKPLGLLCVDDYTARRTIAACRQSGTAIPDDVSIIGVGNSQLDSFFAGIGITSVNVPHAAIGYGAAAQLERQLQGNAEPLGCTRIAPLGLTLRETTGTGALGTLVGRAINYIEGHLDSPLTVQDLADHTHASRRLIELRFREALGRSPHAEITHLRLAKARQLLRDPHIPITSIAAQCGYPEMSHFYARFKQHHDGMPPGAWRKAHA